MPETRDKMTIGKEVEMKAIGDPPADGEKSALQQKLTPRASDWFWQPWYAKLMWVLAAAYWIGLYAMTLTPAGSMGSSVAGAMIMLVFLFNPITVIAILGFGFLKAKVACGDWAVVPGSPLEILEMKRRERDAAYLNPVDIRSGYLHQDYLDELTRRPTDRAGL